MCLMDEAALRQKQEEVAAALRDVGLYEDRAKWMIAGQMLEDLDETPRGPATLVMTVMVGDLAFSDRVQNPAQVGVDAEFAALASELDADAFREAAEEYRRRSENGEDIV